MREIRDYALRELAKVIAEKYESRAEGLLNGSWASEAVGREIVGYLKGLKDALEFAEQIDETIHSRPSAGKGGLGDE